MVRSMTETNLITSYAGESQAHMRYLIYADRAMLKGYPNIARLFTAVAYSERVHAGNHYKNIQRKGEASTFSGALFGSRTVEEDLQNGVDGEHFEVDEMYPAYMEVAKAQNEYASEISFRFAWEAEKTHIALFEKAMDAVQNERDLDLKQVCVCDVCGYTVEGEPPERCPICKAKKERFKVFP